jgi:integrase
MYSDGNRLYLAIDANGRKRWIFRFARNGKQRDMGLGSPLDVTLAEARAAADKANALLRQCIDPLEHKRQAEIQKAIPTFGQFIESFLAQKEHGSQNAKHRAQWRMTLTKYAGPLHDLPLDKISTSDVLKVLQPLWQAKPETASRLRGRIEAVLDAAKAAGHRSGENPAAWAGNLKHLLAAPTKLARGHHEAMPYKDLSAFMARLRGQDGMGAKALQFAILTAAWSGEVRGAAWAEIELEKRLWTIPAARMKSGREHRVPLSDRALEILQELRTLAREDASLIFPGSRNGKPLSDMSLTAVLRRMNAGCTAHGFRSSFRDWAGNETHAQREVCEAALAHIVGDKAEQAYRCSDALDKRRQLMDAWASFLAGTPANVVALRPLA